MPGCPGVWTTDLPPRSHTYVVFPARPSPVATKESTSMDEPRSPLSRRTFLAAAAAGAGTAALPRAIFGGTAAAATVPPQAELPERGIFDLAAATGWTDGFVTGNGEYGAVYHGTPAAEKVVLNHHR